MIFLQAEGGRLRFVSYLENRRRIDNGRKIANEEYIEDFLKSLRFQQNI